MNPQDNPHFTAYALGELSADEARELHQMLARTPAAAHELEQIEAITDALRHGAPIPQTRLTHEQRHAVLHPSNLPRRIQPMQPRQPVRRPQPVFWSVMGTVLKAAAVVAVSGAAFLAGWSFSPVVKHAEELASTAPQEKQPPAPAAEVAPEQAARPALTPEPAKVAAVPQPEVAKTTPAPVPVVAAEVAPKTETAAAQAPRKEVVVVAAPVTAPATFPVARPAAPPPAVPEPLNLGFTLAAGRGSFASTTKQAADQFNLQPALVRPAPPKSKGDNFASPQTPGGKSDMKQPRASEIYIHSWKSEVASCPWNAGHRLLRVVIQLPADQAAVLGQDAVFPLQISFDPANVKQYRMLCERHLAATELRSAGTHVLWYEFQPNGDMTLARDRQIATVTLPGVRFTSQTVGPFDSSKLQIIDRGYALQNSREDFVFEASVVGFGMLLRGTEQTGSLNHTLVLDLAKKARGTETQGERARFVRVVQDAQRMAGL